MTVAPDANATRKMLAPGEAPRGHASFPERIPLVFGIVGHRDPTSASQPALEQSIARLFQRYRVYEHTPAVLLSGLAEGADQLAAKVALANGLSLVAVLPMPLAEYEQDFETEEAKAELRSLLKRASSVFVVPYAADTTAENVREAKAREKQYVALGEHIACRTQILIALCNGEDTGKDGGTAWVLKRRVEAVAAASKRLRPGDPLVFGPTWQVFTPRRSDPECGGVPGAVTVRVDASERRDRLAWKPVNLTEKIAAIEDVNFDRIMRRIDECNGAADRWSEKTDWGHGVNLCKHYLHPEDQAAQLSSALSSIRSVMAMTDHLAAKLKRQTFKHLNFILGCAAVGGVAVEVFGHLLHPHAQAFADQLVALGVYCLFLLTTLLAYLVYRRTQSRKVQEQFQDFRALSELLRVQFHWTQAGIRKSVAETYLGIQSRALDWIRAAAHLTWLAAGGGLPESTLAQSRGDLPKVIEGWVKGQLDFFRRTRSKDHRRYERAEEQVNSCVNLSIIFAALALVIFVVGAWQAFHENEHIPRPTDFPWGSVALVCMGVSLLAAGLLHFNAHKNAWKEHASHYHEMELVFEQALRQLQSLEKNQSGISPENLESAQAVLDTAWF